MITRAVSKKEGHWPPDGNSSEQELAERFEGVWIARRARTYEIDRGSQLPRTEARAIRLWRPIDCYGVADLVASPRFARTPVGVAAADIL